jgi:hypothetical protein
VNGHQEAHVAVDVLSVPAIMKDQQAAYVP